LVTTSAYRRGSPGSGGGSIGAAGAAAVEGVVAVGPAATPAPAFVAAPVGDAATAGADLLPVVDVVSARFAVGASGAHATSVSTTAVSNVSGRNEA
jgi:hypothetical protein